MPRSSSAMRMPRSLSGPTSAKAPVWSHRPRITISFGCARMMAGKPRPAAAAPIFRISLRFMDLPFVEERSLLQTLRRRSKCSDRRSLSAGPQSRNAASTHRDHRRHAGRSRAAPPWCSRSWMGAPAAQRNSPWMPGVTPQTATAHLKKLVAANILLWQGSGREKYFRIAGSEVAQAVEALSELGGGPLHAGGARDSLRTLLLRPSRRPAGRVRHRAPAAPGNAVLANARHRRRRAGKLAPPAVPLLHRLDRAPAAHRRCAGRRAAAPLQGAALARAGAGVEEARGDAARKSDVRQRWSASRRRSSEPSAAPAGRGSARRGCAPCPVKLLFTIAISPSRPTASLRISRPCELPFHPPSALSGTSTGAVKLRPASVETASASPRASCGCSAKRSQST